MVNLLKKGFERREDLDFTDDGARFTAYEYEGIVVTKTTWNKEYFISVRVDYLRDNEFTYDDYAEKDWYKLCDEFNGVAEVDVDKLIENIKIIKKGIEDLKQEIKKDPIDVELIEKHLKEELEEIGDFIRENKTINILRFSESEIRILKSYFDSLKRTEQAIIDKLNKKNYTRYDYKFVQRYGYLKFKGEEEEFYCKEIKNIINK